MVELYLGNVLKVAGHLVVTLGRGIMVAIVVFWDKALQIGTLEMVLKWQETQPLHRW